MNQIGNFQQVLADGEQVIYPVAKDVYPGEKSIYEQIAYFADVICKERGIKYDCKESDSHHGTRDLMAVERYDNL